MGLLLHATALALVSIANSCTTDADCSLLGVCANGSCACDAGWAGPDCARADLLPYDPTAATGYVNASSASWGGHPLPDPTRPGVWTLFVSEMAGGCPLWLFENNSYISRAESASGPGGPFVHVDTVQAPFTHSVQAMGPTADGYYVMYFIGAPAPAAVINCTASGIPPAYVHPNPPSMNLLSIAWATSLAGPWAHRPLFFPNASAPQDAWDCAKTNPAPALLNNGSVLLAFRSTACSGGGTGEYLGIASARHWNDTAYVVSPRPVVAPTAGTGSHEDPCLFEDARGALHIVSHNQGRGNVCARAATQSCGAHLFSGDGGHSWTVSASPVYDLLELANGSSILPATRQRPQLVLDATSKAPLWLFNGAALYGEGNRDLAHLTHTLAFQFAPPRSGANNL